MVLAAGTTLGPYEILSLIGAGGMGEVYRARDPRLNREVAIKVLPADRTSDEDRRRRFIQEAHAASALNHPHIITIYEIESANGIDFIVMEYVRGKSLDALISRHGMRLSEALRIAIPVADALAAAHARGIIHRDLKPANVMVGAEGAVKVLDFGLAKLIGRDEDAAEVDLTHTADVALSVPGTIAGTAAYMSPEQATGRKVDARSDIFSFGAMLYEMVTGGRAFPGTSTIDTLTAVVRDQPKRPSEVTPGVPPDLEKVILRCLRKEPERRFHHSADLRVALQEVKEESESGGIAAAPLARRRHGALAVLALGLLIAGLAAWLLWSRPHADASRKLVSLTTLTGHANWPTFSPDGQQVAFGWQPEGQDNYSIYVKLVGLDDVRRLTTDPSSDCCPSWSPDGRQIAFVRLGSQSTTSTIHLVSPMGGGERKLSDVAGGGIAWSPDGRYLAVAGGDKRPGIYLIPAAGGEPRLIIPTVVSDGGLAFSHDGRRLAYASCKGGGTDCPLTVVELDADFTPTEPPRSLTPQPPYMIWGVTWSHDGRSVIYGALEAVGESLWRIRVDEGSPPERLEFGMKASWPAIAASGDRLAFSRNLEAHVPYRFEAGRPSQPLLTSSISGGLHFSPDGHRIAYCANAGEALEVWTAKADGSEPHQLTQGPGRWQCSPHWSPDGARIAFDSRGADGYWHIWSIAADGGIARQVTREEGSQNVPSWSRDGQWIYYSWNGDIWRIHLADGRKQRLTSEGGVLLALESGDGRSLLHERRGALLAMPLAGGPSRQIAPCFSGFTVARTSGGVYYVACPPAGNGSNADLHLVNAATGEDRVVGTLEKYGTTGVFGLAVSPDGKVIVYERLLREGHDLMLIENFR